MLRSIVYQKRKHSRPRREGMNEYKKLSELKPEVFTGTGSSGRKPV